MARLSEEQKKKLDRLILKYYPEKEWGETLSVKEILDTISTDNDFINGVSEVNIRFAMSRLIAMNRNCTYEYSRGIYDLKEKILYRIPRGFKIWKEKNILIIPNIINKDNPLKFNFSTGKIENEDFSQNCIRDDYGDIADLLRFGQKYEWIFNYCHNIDQVWEITESEMIPQEYKEKCPKGLINFLKEKGWVFDVDTYKTYIFMNEYGKYYKLALNLKMGYASSVNVDKEILQKITKMGSNSILVGEEFTLSTIREMLRLYNTVKLMDNTVLLDDNRSLKCNIHMLEDIKDREKNEFLAKQMQKLNFINNLEIGDYIIKVPQNQAEKVEEGQMQNNCVGHYYDNTILRGENFIYFIREKENPNKSFITCRYNKKSEKTTEYRKKNNYTVTEDYLKDMIKEIDNIINSNKF